MMTLLAGALLGLAGSAHCAAMCGPLAIGVAARLPGGGGRVTALVTYHAGRLLVYVLLAIPAGLVGQALSAAGLGRGIAIASGVLLLALAWGARTPTGVRRAGRRWSGVLARGSLTAARLSGTHPVAARLMAGAVNGLLPCGLVYPAAMAGAALGSLPAAMLFMAGFGLGTLPSLLTIAWVAANVPARAKARLRRLAPAALALTGLLLIVRGLVPTAHIHPGSPSPPAIVVHTH